MDSYALHLAMAALVGATFAAASAYYMHRKTLTQLLDFARAIERERERDGGGGGGEKRSPRRRSAEQHHPTDRRSARRYYRCGGVGVGSISLPNVLAAAAADGEDDEEEEEEERRTVVSAIFSAEEDYRDLLIPPGLPRLHTVPEGN